MLSGQNVLVLGHSNLNPGTLSASGSDAVKMTNLTFCPFLDPKAFIRHEWPGFRFVARMWRGDKELKLRISNPWVNVMTWGCPYHILYNDIFPSFQTPFNLYWKWTPSLSMLKTKCETTVGAQHNACRSTCHFLLHWALEKKCLQLHKRVCSFKPLTPPHLTDLNFVDCSISMLWMKS